MNRTERHQLSAVIADFRKWATTAWEICGLAGHLPISGAVALSDSDKSVLAFVERGAAQDADDASRLTRPSWFGGRKNMEPAQAAAQRLSWAHREFLAAEGDAALARLRGELSSRSSEERERVDAALAHMERFAAVASRALDDVAHMPFSRTGVLDQDEQTLLESTVRVYELHSEEARRLLDARSCADGACEGAHRSAALLADVHREALSSGDGERIHTIAAKMASRLEVEQVALKNLSVQADHWKSRAAGVRRTRTKAAAVVGKAVKQHLESAVDVRVGDQSLKLSPLVPADVETLQSLVLLRDAPITSSDEQALTHAAESARRLIASVKSGFDENWQCTRDGRCAEAHALLPLARVEAIQIEDLLQRLSRPGGEVPGDLETLREPSLNLAEWFPSGLRPSDVLGAGLTNRARNGAAAIAHAGKAAKKAAARAKEAADLVRAGDIATALKAMDLEVLRKASSEKIRTGPLVGQGLSNVWDVLRFQEKYILASVPGLGETTARGIAQAALRLREGVREETPVRIDVKRRSKNTAALLEALRDWDTARRFEPTSDELAVARAVREALDHSPKATHLLVVAESAKADAAPDVREVLASALARSVPQRDGTDVWTKFLSRPADYFGMLTELGFVTEDEKKMHGDLPEEIIEAVRAKELKRDFLKASLRTYQSFGARFALVQERVVIGDEMGLGKTVEALTVVCHLRAAGHSHFLVVCPAAVVSNWIRETAKHTQLAAHRLHGPMWERTFAAKSWIRNGGVAVTTYDLLAWAQELIKQAEVTAAIFDEAHYIKNPSAKRSLVAQSIIDELPYSILMTGTPLENRVQEFRNLIGYIRPDLSESAPEYLPSKFRKHVAPAYLRRNQEDVLTELPELVEIDEWMGLSESDERAYRRAVADGHFMTMRRAAMLSERSMKVDRLKEIVAEAEDNERRVIVFSYFREVLSEVAQVLPGKVFGPLTGSMPARDRQRLVDDFSAAPEGSVLVAQITAGGVGLNIQSASVVVICEPQVKPTMEAQAIARAHRMGQTNTVQVHRLLTENSVDERIREILAEKRQLFNDFARESVIAERAPDAVDVSDAELARMVIAAERERLFGQPHD